MGTRLCSVAGAASAAAVCAADGVGESSGPAMALATKNSPSVSGAASAASVCATDEVWESSVPAAALARKKSLPLPEQGRRPVCAFFFFLVYLGGVMWSVAKDGPKCTYDGVKNIYCCLVRLIWGWGGGNRPHPHGKL